MFSTSESNHTMHGAAKNVNHQLAGPCSLSCGCMSVSAFQKYIMCICSRFSSLLFDIDRAQASCNCMEPKPRLMRDMFQDASNSANRTVE